MNESPARILVVDDEVNLALGIAENLALEGHSVEVVHDGARALERLSAEAFDLVLLDVMLPELDGYSVCERLRAAGNEVPVLFLTAKGLVEDRVRGLAAGGDDYLPKPFALQELLLRTAAILKRRRWYAEPSAGGRALLTFGGNEVDFATYQGRAWDGSAQHLTHKEAMILKCLSEREGQVVPREGVLEAVWGYDVYPSTRTIDNFILRLRKRFERDPEDPRHFHTVRGVGYRFTQASEHSP